MIFVSVLDRLGCSFIQIQHLENATFPEAIFEPQTNRVLLDCDGHPGNLTINDLCNPCGVSCDEESCDNWKCALACADKDFDSRVFDETWNETQSTGPFYFRYDSLSTSYSGNSSGRAS